MNSRISPIRAELLRILICAEPTILSKVQNWDGGESKTAKKVAITEDGRVFFYYGSGPMWLQRLIGDYETISILDVAIRIADAVTGSGDTRNDVVFDEITASILKEAVKNKDFDCVIDILFDIMRNGSNGVLHSKYINQENIKKYMKKERTSNKSVVVESDLYGFVGIQQPDGRVLPLKIGKVVYKNQY